MFRKLSSFDALTSIPYPASFSNDFSQSVATSFSLQNDIFWNDLVNVHFVRNIARFNRVLFREALESAERPHWNIKAYIQQTLC